MSPAVASRRWPVRFLVVRARPSTAPGAMPPATRACPTRCGTNPTPCSTRRSSMTRCRRRPSSRSWPRPSCPTPLSARAGSLPSRPRCSAKPNRRHPGAAARRPRRIATPAPHAKACAANCCVRIRRAFSTACSASTWPPPPATGRGRCRTPRWPSAGTPVATINARHPVPGAKARAAAAASTTCSSVPRSTCGAMPIPCWRSRDPRPSRWPWPTVA